MSVRTHASGAGWPVLRSRVGEGVWCGFAARRIARTVTASSTVDKKASEPDLGASGNLLRESTDGPAATGILTLETDVAT